MIDISKYVDFLVKNELTEHQFLILWLIYTKDGTNIAKYRKAFDQFDTEQILELVDNGWIEDFGVIRDNLRTYNINNFLVTPKFTDTVVIDGYEAFDELVAHYPRFLKINNIKTSTMTGGYDDLAEYYNDKVIKSSRSKHEMIMSVVKKLGDNMNRYNISGIKKFLETRQYMFLLEDEEFMSSSSEDVIRDR